jgi:hypothetical protein
LNTIARLGIQVDVRSCVLTELAVPTITENGVKAH